LPSMHEDGMAIVVIGGPCWRVGHNQRTVVKAHLIGEHGLE
jgi:hypothetical protein